jgi:nitrite reductase/ring-hydroxylating ferredoxin subunit
MIDGSTSSSKDTRKLVKVADTRSTPPGTVIVVKGIDIVDICLVNANGNYYAVSSVCTHIGGPLSKCDVENEHIICPWHKAYFDLKDGRGFFPARRPLRKFDVRVDGQDVYITVANL